MQRFKGILRLLIRCFSRGMKLLVFCILAYSLFVVVGLIPANRGFEPTEDGIEIFVVSNSVHSDIIVPKTSEIMDWTTEFEQKHFGKHFVNRSHVAFGWGDRNFYLETESWQDMKISRAANALFLPSSCCVHVEFANPESYLHARAITISKSQYARLVEFLLSSFKTNGKGNKQRISGYAYSDNDAFFEARGSYHLFNTCNSWVGRGLRSAGIKTPCFTPLPGLPTLYLNKVSTDK